MVGAVLIVLCLSSGPFVALSRWVARRPLALETWPYVYTFWIAALVGFGLFVVDVVVPTLRTSPVGQRLLLGSLAGPVGLAGWTLSSVLWTDSPTRTPQQALLMALVMATAIWFGLGLTFREQALSLFIGLHALTVVSVSAALVLDSARATNGAWIGVFNNPNSLSPVAGLGVVAAIGVLTLIDRPWKRAVVGLAATVDLLAVWKASSVTGWLAVGGAGVAMGLVFVGRGLAARRIPAIGIRLAAATLAAVSVVTIPWSFRLIAGRVGKDGSLTGRTDIWDYVFDVVADRWVTGFGFQSFWDDEANRRALSARRSVTWMPDAAHSSFMETLLFLGVVGLGLILIVVLLSFAGAWWSALGSSSWSMAWWVGVATFALLENLMESMIAYHSIFWVLLVAPGLAVARAAVSSPPRR